MDGGNSNKIKLRNTFKGKEPKAIDNKTLRFFAYMEREREKDTRAIYWRMHMKPDSQLILSLAMVIDHNNNNLAGVQTVQADRL